MLEAGGVGRGLCILLMLVVAFVEEAEPWAAKTSSSMFSLVFLPVGALDQLLELGVVARGVVHDHVGEFGELRREVSVLG